jgi:signal peptidase II
MSLALERFVNMPNSTLSQPSVLRQLPWLWWGVAVLVIALDQATKIAAQSLLELNGVHRVTSFFYLTLRYNEGAAFSFLHGAGGWQRWFFAGTAGAVSLLLVVWISRIHRQREKLLETLALSLILGGAVGNLYDRVLLGHVTDFIVWHYQTREWPAFNIADSAICLGAALLFLDMFKGHKKSHE